VEDGTPAPTVRAAGTAGLVTAAVMAVAATAAAAMVVEGEIDAMIVALASPRVASSLDDGLDRIKRLLNEASAQGAEIVCFPEAYLPGLRGQDFEVPPFDQKRQEQALHAVAQWARTHAVAAILGMERLTEAGRQIAAYVIDAQGQIQGYQTKNQLDPTEDRFYVPGATRRLFEINRVKFGVAICHEGWRYPETVRWAAVRGAKIVFHPQHTGSEKEGVRLTEWGAADSPYYEKAMMMRSRENTIYFASVNYALRFQESATSLIAPSGECQAYLPYGQEGVLVQALNLEQATGLLATRYAPDRM
jgi:predicted amidohydrolase